MNTRTCFIDIPKSPLHLSNGKIIDWWEFIIGAMLCQALSFVIRSHRGAIVTRRHFIALTAAASAAAPIPQHASVRFAAQPFELSRVRLRPGIFLDCAGINRRYMLGLSQDSLLHMFRVTAG